jgi:hypothetical protein
MNSTLIATLILLGAGTPGAVPESLRFTVSPGTVLQKNLSVKHELALDGVLHSRDGGAPIRQDSTGWVSSWFKITCNDTYLSVADGRPLHLQRTFTDLGAGGNLTINRSAQAKKFEDRAVLTSPMRGRTIDFNWIEEEKDWSRAWVRDDAEEFWLAELRGDMDGLGLLPAGEVEIGAEWEVPIDVVRSLLAPGGNSLITPRTTNIFGRTIEAGVGGDMSEVLGPELAGRLLVRFEGTRETDGHRLGVLKLTIESLHSVVDRTDLWRTAAPEDERREPAKLVATLITYTLDATGEALWNLGDGHLHSVELAGNETFVLSVDKVGGPIEEPWAVNQLSSFPGRLQLTYSVGPPPPVDPEADPNATQRDH